MQLIDADKAQPGTTITALLQTAGKGQRGKTWADSKGKSLLMSMIVAPQCKLDHQFVFSASIAVAVAEVLQSLYQPWQVQIKWPNDIIVNAKKAGGILIENVLRGSAWPYSVIGLGLNVLQDDLGEALPFATSLKKESGVSFGLEELLQELRERIVFYTSSAQLPGMIMTAYNNLILRADEEQVLIRDGREEVFRIKEVRTTGELVVMNKSGKEEWFRHGEVEWKWG